MTEVLHQMPSGSPFAPGTLRPSASHTSFFDSSARFSPRKSNNSSLRKNSVSHSDLSSHPDLRSDSTTSSQSSSSRSTPASSLSLGATLDYEDSDTELAFSDYDSADRYNHDAAETPPSSPLTSNRLLLPPADGLDPTSTPIETPDPLPTHYEDDTSVRPAPSQQVDYLSYEWKEEDIWSSWRHIVERRKHYGERSRLENASWRTWAKSQFKLRTVSPETLNWLKDYDVTWLYGPLQPATNRIASHQLSGPASRLSKTNSFLLNKKPILKKRTMSEVMLQQCISASSLVKHAAAAVQAQQADGTDAFARRRYRPIIGRASSDFATPFTLSRTVSKGPPTNYFSSQSTSGLHTPSHGERKHIRFDDKVEQCIAVDCKGDEEDDAYIPWQNPEDSSDDEGMVMMKRSRKKKPLSRNTSKSDLAADNQIIAPLPSTTLKDRTDSPDVTGEHPSHSIGLFRSSRLSPSPSQETLRPSNPSSNFLLAEDDEDDEEDPWEPSSTFQFKRPGTPTQQNPHLGDSLRPGVSGGLRRTASGMFMPEDEDEDEDPQPPGIIGRVVDTVNTARDIAHVIWNVGWTRN